MVRSKRPICVHEKQELLDILRMQKGYVSFYALLEVVPKHIDKRQLDNLLKTMSREKMVSRRINPYYKRVEYAHPEVSEAS